MILAATGTPPAVGAAPPGRILEILGLPSSSPLTNSPASLSAIVVRGLRLEKTQLEGAVVMPPPKDRIDGTGAGAHEVGGAELTPAPPLLPRTGARLLVSFLALLLEPLPRGSSLASGCGLSRELLGDLRPDPSQLGLHHLRSEGRGSLEDVPRSGRSRQTLTSWRRGQVFVHVNDMVGVARTLSWNSPPKA